MRAANRNKQLIYYSNYVSSSQKYRTDNPDLISPGLIRTYTTPKPLRICVSNANAWREQNCFGTYKDYTNVLTSTNMDLDINEDTIIWINESPDNPYTHEVKRVAPTINSVRYALKSVTESVNPQFESENTSTLGKLVLGISELGVL